MFHFALLTTVVIILLKGFIINLYLNYTNFHFSEITIFRLEHLWRDEVKRKGEHSSLTRVIWKFIKTRVILDMFLYLTSLAFGFIGPVRNSISFNLL